MPTTRSTTSSTRRLLSHAIAPLLLSALLALWLASPARAQNGNGNGEPQTQPAEDREAELLTQLTGRKALLATAQDATRLALTAQTTAIGEISALLAIPAEGLFTDPWAVDLEHLQASDPSVITAPQDAEYDRSLQEYTSLVGTRQKLDRLNRWKLGNEAALSYMSKWLERLQRLRRELVELQDARRALRTAVDELVTTRTNYGDTRSELSRLIGADDPRLAEFPENGESLLIEASAASAPTGLQYETAISFLSDIDTFFETVSGTLEQHRATRREQEELLFERRSLLERVLHRKTRGIVATAGRGLELGDLGPLFDEAESLSGRLNMARDLLLLARVEEILVRNEAYLLTGESERVARLRPMQPLQNDPLGPVVAALDTWRKEYEAFTRVDPSLESAGLLDAHINGVDGESRRIEAFIDSERRAITGLTSDFAAIDERIRAGVSQLERDSELDALKGFFDAQRGQATRRLDTIDAAIAEQRDQRATLTAELTDYNARVPDLVTAIAEAETAIEAEPNIARRVQLWSQLFAQQGELSTLQNRISLIESEIAILETAEAELAEDRARLQGLAQFWDERVTAVEARIQQRQDEKQQAIEVERDSQQRAVINRWIGVGIVIVLAIMILWGVRLLGRNIDTRLEAAEKRHQKERYQRLRTIMTFVRGLVMIGTITSAFVAILFIVGVGEDVIQWLVGSVGVIALAVSFGAQSLVKDFFNGFFILLENQYVQGDWIKIEDIEGNVESVGLRTTVLRDFSGNRHVFNNGSITHVCNMTARFARAVIDLGLSYNDKPEVVIPVLTEFCEHLGEEEVVRHNLMTKLEKPRVLGVQAFADSEITYRILITTRPGQQWAVAREVRRLLHKVVEKHGFSIPFPHRTVYTHSEDK